MYKSAFIISFIIISFIFLINPQKSFAQYTCNGTFTCSKTVATCTDTNCTDPLYCNCPLTTQSITQDCSLTSPSGSSCDAANMNLICVNGGYSTVTDNCITSPVATPAPCNGDWYYGCGSGYCCGLGNTCANQNTGTCSNALTPTPTLTPCPGVCSTASGPGGNYTPNSAYDAYCQAQPNGNQDAYCWVSSGSTPTCSTTSSTEQCQQTSCISGWTQNSQTCNLGAVCCTLTTPTPTGSCTGAQTCTPGTYSCSNNSVSLCDSCGHPGPAASCGSNYTCKTVSGVTACVKNQCTPGTTYTCSATAC